MSIAEIFNYAIMIIIAIELGAIFIMMRSMNIINKELKTILQKWLGR
jgi:hypothetical protein